MYSKASRIVARTIRSVFKVVDLYIEEPEINRFNLSEHIFYNMIFFVSHGLSEINFRNYTTSDQLFSGTYLQSLISFKNSKREMLNDDLDDDIITDEHNPLENLQVYYFVY
jgi:hypothetical protein